VVTVHARADADCDGDVDSFDGLEILRVLAGVAERRVTPCVAAIPAIVTGGWADIDCDGVVGMSDVLGVLRKVAGIDATECASPVA
jgi:hypothetical protein